MSAVDSLVYNMASADEEQASIFVRKDWLQINDNNNGQYGSNQCIIDTSQLSNSNRYLNYKEAYLQIPMLLTATFPGEAASNGFKPDTAATSLDYGFGLKNWFGSIIHSFSLDLNGTTVVQLTPFIGLWNTFKLISTLSWNDVITQGPHIGFYPDSALSFSYSGATASLLGTGTSNTQNSSVVTAVSGAFNSYDTTNTGFLKRQQYINYNAAALTDPNGSAFSTLLTATTAATLNKSYILTRIANNGATTPGVFQIAIIGTVYLKHLHSFFQNVPLLKGTFFKMTLNLNNTTTTMTVSTGAAGAQTLTLLGTSNPQGGVNPILVASTKASNGLTNLTCNNAQTLTVNLSVGQTCLNTAQSSLTGVVAGGLSKIVTLNVPSYVFAPVFEQAYLSEPVKKIVYNDVYQYTILGTAAGSTFNTLVTNGIANIKEVLVLPFHNSTTTAATGVAGVPPFQSPFDTAGSGTTSPLCLINNFNVVISGQNALYNTQRYSYEMFNQQVLGQSGEINGKLVDGLTSGLISHLDWEMLYNFYYVNVSRMLPVEQSVPKSVSIIGTNQSALAVDYYVFVSYGVEIALDALSGSRV